MGSYHTASSSSINTALQAMEQAYQQNRDANVGSLITQAMNALHELALHGSPYAGSCSQAETDPYELNELNSTI